MTDMEKVSEFEQEYRGGDSGVKYLLRGPDLDWGVILLKPGDRLGGHFVTGHVDGRGVITEKDELPGECRMRAGVNPQLARQMVLKGSVAVDGISLTVAGLQPDSFEVSLIPYTLAATTLQYKGRGSEVNIECDVIGKWVRKLVQAVPEWQDSRITVERLKEEGF